MKPKETKPPRDVNQNAQRIFDEAIKRSEEPPNRGTLEPADKPAGVAQRPARDRGVKKPGNRSTGVRIQPKKAR